MNKISVFFIAKLLLVVLSANGQFIQSAAKQSDTEISVEYLKAAIKRIKLPENQYVSVTDNGVIILMGFLMRVY